MITKQCQFSGRDERGEYIHLLRAGYDNEQLVKTAAASPPQLARIRAFMKDRPRTPDRIYTLISALGAGEFWGSNSNADYFGVEPLLHTPPSWDAMPLEQQRLVGARWEWGYPTFYNAHAFAHHVNKDPNRAFGFIEYAMWDSAMKRVLLTVAYDRARARQFGSIGVLDRIENGEFPSVSMGTRVPFDCCSICCNLDALRPYLATPQKIVAMHRQNPIRGLSTDEKKYCVHLRTELNKIYPDGRKVMMLNLHPRFFDLSVVFIGADKTSYILAKLANECPIQPGQKSCSNCSHTECVPSAHVHEVWSRKMEKTAECTAASPKGQTTRELAKHYAGQIRGAVVAARQEKRANIDFNDVDPQTEREINTYLMKQRTKLGAIPKGAEITKHVASSFRRNLPTLTSHEPDLPEEVQNRMSENPRDSLRTAGSMGIVLKPHEFQRMMIRNLGRPELADDLDSKGLTFRPGAEPSDFRLGDSIVPKILEALLPLMRGRSAMTPALGQRTIIIIKSSAAPQDTPRCLDDPFLDKISSDYTAYRRALLYNAPGLIRESIFTRPKVASALYHDQILDPGLAKIGGDVMESMIGMLSSIYMNEAHMEKPVSMYVREHSSLAGLEKASGFALLGGVA